MRNFSPLKNGENLDPAHANKRAFLRVVGPILLLIGVLFMIVGVVDFFSGFGQASPMRMSIPYDGMGGATFGSELGGPDKFWCLFIGMPLIFVGGAMMRFGYMGTVARYQAGEIAPVGKDVINYMGREAQPGIRSISQAFHNGRKDASAERANVQKENIEARIRRLEQMRDSGLINAEDFEEQKDRILSEL